MLAIAGGKGGSGKTTTTLGLAAALDGPALAVDADVDMPNLHALAGVPREPTLAAAEGRDPAAVARPHPERDGVTVLPAPTAGESGAGAAALARRLTRLRDVEATTLIDCPAGAGPDAAAPIRAADGVLLVASPCAPALRDTAKTAATARALGTPVVGALLVRARAAPDGVADLLGGPVLGRIPPATPPVLDAPAVRDAYRRAAAALAGRGETPGNSRKAFQ